MRLINFDESDNSMHKIKHFLRRQTKLYLQNEGEIKTRLYYEIITCSF